LLLELQGHLPLAAAAAEEATRKESVNWRTWFILARLEAERGRVRPSIRAYRRAHALNPKYAFLRP